jgi:biopolymer transport protein TolQ
MISLISIAHAAPAAKVGVKAGVWDSVINASFAVQILLIVLIVLSVVSWGIIISKWSQFKRFDVANTAFLDRFWKATSLEAVYDKIAEFPDSNIARVFKAAYLELQRIAESSLGKTPTEVGEAVPRLGGLDNLERALRKAVDTELSSAEGRLNFLATTGSTSPFIGLLGTVVGIMTSFSQIASTGSASLAVVAPGISEALFSTAVGLFAAIPAVVAYNFYISRTRKLEMDLNNFSSDFLNIAKRNFFKE